MAETKMFDSNYCDNCRHLPVCKLAIKITENDLAINTFNSDNFEKNRIRVANVTYDCRYKLTVSAQ